MMKRRGFLATLNVLLLIIAAFTLSSCIGIDDTGNEIVSVEVVQLPYRMAYVAGVDDSLDMEGCVIRLFTRDGNETDSLFGNWSFVTARHQIDFSTPGEYDVVFYWGDTPIHMMTIQVVAPN